MLYTFISITFLGAAIGWSVIYTLLFVIEKQLMHGALRSHLQREILNTDALNQLLDNVNWEEEISPLIDVQLDKLMETFKQRNPMIALFLTQEVAKPLQDTAKEQLLNMIPKLKKILVDRLTQEKALFYIEGELSRRLKTILRESSLRSQLQRLGIAVGTLLGIVGAFVMSWFN